MAHLTPPHCVTLNWQSQENIRGQGILAPLHLAGIRIMRSTGRGALGVISPLVLQSQDSSYPPIFLQPVYKHFFQLCHTTATVSVSSGLTFEACTFPHILHYNSMERGGVAFSSLIAAPYGSLPTHHPSVLFIFRLVNISLCIITGHPQTTFNQSQGLGTHHLGWRRFLFPLFYIPHSLLSCAVLPLPAQVSSSPQPL